MYSCLGILVGYMRHTLRWFSVSLRINYRIAALVWRCLIGIAPTYLRGFRCSVSSLVGGRGPRSSSSGELSVPRVETSIAQRRPFSIVALPFGMHFLLREY